MVRRKEESAFHLAGKVAFFLISSMDALPEGAGGE